MRVIIAGSRDLSDPDLLVAEAVDESGFTVTTVISGTARGIDQAGERWAAARGIPVERHPADWNRYGKSAGPRRNEQMAEVADALIAVTNGSKGTAWMIQFATDRGLKVYVKRVETA